MALDETNDQSSCLMESRPAPCLLVIFGASGDLTGRMLFPALAKLHDLGAMPERFAIVGVARSPLGTEIFRDRMRQALEEAGRFHAAGWRTLAPRVFYHAMEYDDPDGYRRLGDLLTGLDRDLGLGGNRIFYLATPPSLFPVAAEGLGRAGLAGKGPGGQNTRVVVEKPFGRDLDSSRLLADTLHQWFREGQILRIDHYLAKETIQNILLFRFANSVFEPVWNHHHIEYVSITSAESLGVGHRAGFYEQSGVLRDMFQNHMMQLLALVAMEPPPTFEANMVRDEKVKVYRSLRPFDPDRWDRDLVLGQYGPGLVGGREVPGYRQEKDVSPLSPTPTYAMLRAYVDNWRWRDVPFYLCSGKRLASKLTRMVVQFRSTPAAVFRPVLGDIVTSNRLVLDVHPDQAITMGFQVKRPGGKLCLRTAAMRFDFDLEGDEPGLDAYEKVLLDCMLGDSMLFLRQDAVEWSWRFFTPILEMCESCQDLSGKLHSYPAGGWGPDAALSIHPDFLRDTA